MGRFISIEFSFVKRLLMLLIVISIFSNSFNNKVIEAVSPDKPLITSEAAILIDGKTGRTLYEKKPDKKMNPASLTKIATAIYAIENGNLDDLVTVSHNAREVVGTRVYLEEGEKITLKRLIQGLLINSGNDAGVAIAEHLDGSVEGFATSLNRYLRDLGLQNTNFVNPHGLYHPEHQTTARDLALITKYAMKNRDFREIFGTKELKWNGKSWDTTIYTHHKLMRQQPYDGITGGKTGYVVESGITLVTTATRGELSLIAVTLNAPSEDIAYHDTVDLLDYGFDNFNVESISEGQLFAINNEEYINNDILIYTISKNEKIHQQITNDGLLELKNDFQDVIATFQLERITTLNDKNVSETKDSQIKDHSNYTFIYVLFFTMFVLALLMISRWFYRNFNKKMYY
ncbi:D-alanyl-D-alanine carboxypeptidase family protein [Ureibacillus acetophenoni]|uniref:D-alanyl-D-alanine carboxypeptidase n=1 Tax=Ureibacillus acetophenoni TaxID=614649 RepID=A0A285UMD1_9BACL|nr:D-alanyl-D-alanine carboxypeptidase family protein [Ureibacillus acetophenoni]SOC42972.1 D-alanyl-D-alanine carboxypeptidase [Ureibacillus acetophenoni]